MQSLGFNSLCIIWVGLGAQAINTGNYKLAIGIRAGETSGIGVKLIF